VAARLLLYDLRMSVIDLSQHVINAVVAHVLRNGRPPRVVLGTSNDDLRLTLAEELRTRGFEVLEAAHVRTLHGALLRALEKPSEHALDLVVVDSTIDGCSPLHALSYARRKGLDASAILLADEDDHARAEAPRLGMQICSRAFAAETIDRNLLRVLRKGWTERPVAA
jgi:CheY-like chemotaxis protein